jgi:hypothetical protein
LLGAASLTAEIECPDTFTLNLSLVLFLNIGLDRRFDKIPVVQIAFIFFLIIPSGTFL